MGPDPGDPVSGAVGDGLAGGAADATAALLGRCRFPPAGTQVACAVSGGADSLALLVLAVAAGCRATAIHVDHGLRPGSADEAEVVRHAAQRLGADFAGVKVEVAPGPNLEARARRARYQALPPQVMTGHTADDRAETVLLHLLRGAGVSGLSAMTPGHRHPILALRRHQTVELCEAVGLPVVHDPSNLDPIHRRNRVRHELLPLASDVAGRDLVPVLTRQADLLAEVDELLQELAGHLDVTSAPDLAGAPPAVARVSLRRWLVEAGVGDGYVVDAAAVERVLAVARGSVVATELAGGWRVQRSANRLTVLPPPA